MLRMLARNGAKAVGYAVMHPKRTWAVRKACRNHVRRQPTCQWCGGTKGVEAHHIEPMWANYERAADPSNFVSLCRPRRCHLLVGHGGSFATRFVSNVVEVCQNRRIVTRDRKMS